MGEEPREPGPGAVRRLPAEPQRDQLPENLRDQHHPEILKIASAAATGPPSPVRLHHSRRSSMKQIFAAALGLGAFAAGGALALTPGMAPSRPDAPYNGQPMGPNPADPSPPPPPSGPRPPDIVAHSLPIDLAV